jgi:hypothetical protein
MAVLQHINISSDHGPFPFYVRKVWRYHRGIFSFLYNRQDCYQTIRVTLRRVSFMKEELLTLLEHLGSLPFFSVVNLLRFSCLCCVFCFEFCLLWQMLPVSLDCSFLIVSSGFSLLIINKYIRVLFPLISAFLYSIFVFNMVQLYQKSTCFKSHS